MFDEWFDFTNSVLSPGDGGGSEYDFDVDALIAQDVVADFLDDPEAPLADTVWTTGLETPDPLPIGITASDMDWTSPPEFSDQELIACGCLADLGGTSVTDSALEASVAADSSGDLRGWDTRVGSTDIFGLAWVSDIAAGLGLDWSGLVVDVSSTVEVPQHWSDSSDLIVDPTIDFGPVAPEWPGVVVDPTQVGSAMAEDHAAITAAASAYQRELEVLFSAGSSAPGGSSDASSIASPSMIMDAYKALHNLERVNSPLYEPASNFTNHSDYLWHNGMRS